MERVMKSLNTHSSYNFGSLYHQAYRAYKNSKEKTLHEELTQQKNGFSNYYKSAYRVEFSKEAKELLGLFSQM